MNAKTALHYWALVRIPRRICPQWNVQTILKTLFLGCLLSTSSMAWAQSSYIITDLGTLGGTSSAAFDINNYGQIVGGANGHAFLYENGAMTDLGNLGGALSAAEAINNSGQIAGWSYNPINLGGTPHAVLYDNGAIIDLGTLPQGSISHAQSINDIGQIVGYSQTNNDTTNHAFLYENGVMIDFLGAQGGTSSAALEINNKGQIVGNSNSRAFLYENGVMIDLGTLGGVRSDAYSINDNQQIVGQAWTAKGEPHAFLYDNGIMSDLGMPGGYSNINDRSSAHDINNKGQIVGQYTANEIIHAFLYESSEMVDLNSLLPANSDWTLVAASAINDVGQIVGVGHINGQSRAFLMSPAFILNISKSSGSNNGRVISQDRKIDCGATCSANFAVGTVVNLTADPDDGSIFTGWSDNGCSGIGTCEVTMDADKSVTAHFAPATYNITTVINPEGAGTVSCTANPVNYGDDSICTANAADGYTFSEWIGNCSITMGNQCTLNNVTSNQDLTAHFTLNRYTLTVNQDSNSTGSGTVSGAGIFDYNTLVEPIAVADSSSTFAGWNQTICSTPFHITNDTTCTAKFILKTYHITTAVNPLDTGSVSCTPNLVNAGSTSTCTITPNIGYGIAGITGCGGTLSGNTYTTGRITENCQVEATFAPTGPALRINDVSKFEGNKTTTAFTFTVALSPASTGTVKVAYATANGTALAGSDYTASGGTLKFTAGQTSKTVTVKVIGDKNKEIDETFFVNLSSPSGATIIDNQGIGTILNDD